MVSMCVCVMGWYSNFISPPKKREKAATLFLGLCKQKTKRQTQAATVRFSLQLILSHCWRFLGWERDLLCLCRQICSAGWGLWIGFEWRETWQNSLSHIRQHHLGAGSSWVVGGDGSLSKAGLQRGELSWFNTSYQLQQKGCWRL